MALSIACWSTASFEACWFWAFVTALLAFATDCVLESCNEASWFFAVVNAIWSLATLAVAWSTAACAAAWPGVPCALVSVAWVVTSLALSPSSEAWAASRFACWLARSWLAFACAEFTASWAWAMLASCRSESVPSAVLAFARFACADCTATFDCVSWASFCACTSAVTGAVSLSSAAWAVATCACAWANAACTFESSTVASA